MSDFPADALPPETPHSIPEQNSSAASDPVFDFLVVGAGPTGLACAIEAKKAGFSAVLVDKGCVCNSLYHYPSHMTFFTTSELLEIGDIPFPSPNAKPSRNEALEYYRQVAAFYKLDVRQYRRVERIAGTDGAFEVHTTDRFGRAGILHARKLAISTGYYDLPNLMKIPGEELSKVQHYYDDPHPYFGLDVVVDGRQKFGGDCCAGAVAARRAGHADPSRPGDSPPCEVLDQAGHRKPDQERRDQGVLPWPAHGDYARMP